LFGEEIGVVVQKSQLPGEYKNGYPIIVTGRAAIGNPSFFDDRIDNSPRWGRRISVMIAQCLISFGSNLGDRDELIAAAARRIADSSVAEPSCPLTTSRLFETPPIGGPGGQEPFLNAIGRLDTRASAREILELLQEIEHELGRQRRQRWDARSIDLDVVLHGELVGGGSGLIVPHPRYTARQFVLQPACDVAADLRDPRFGWTLKRLTEHLSAGVPSLALVGGDLSIRQQICDRLSAEYGIQTFAGQPSTHPIGVVANVPASLHGASESLGGATAVPGQRIVATDDAWVAAYLPSLPALDSEQTQWATVPRLLARLQRTTAQTRWPAPHQMWPTGWRWPEYRLEIDDISWAVREVASALDSMRCPVTPITDDGHWWE
jgi:2-amino-4-hydroxy-6-hydroxymethyldihydropteridine diphosphokinase